MRCQLARIRQLSSMPHTPEEALHSVSPNGASSSASTIAATLIRHGINVHIFNQRSVAEIFSMIAQLGGMVGAQQQAKMLIAQLQGNIERARAVAEKLPRRPRVFFEEWYDPLISGIGWVSELIGIAGGDDIFPELAKEPGAKQRIIADPLQVVARNPDIVIASWCGRKFRAEKVLARAGWEKVAAVRDQQLFEIKSPLILQPGPAALSDGLAALQRIIAAWAARQ